MYLTLSSVDSSSRLHFIWRDQVYEVCLIVRLLRQIYYMLNNLGYTSNSTKLA